MYIFDDHHEEWQLNTQGFLCIEWAGDVGSSYIGAHDLENRGEDVLISQSFDMAILN
jgi:hypothetical protein